MHKKLLITLIILIVLAAAIGGWLLRHTSHTTLAPNTAAASGLRLTLMSPLPSDSLATITDAHTQSVKHVTLTKGGTIYNIPLDPGFYQLQLTSTTDSFSPVAPSAFTVTQGTLHTMELYIGTGK